MERERHTHIHTHIQWELMNLSSAYPSHNPTGILISCGSLTAKTHRYRYTHLHTHLFRGRLWSWAVCGKGGIQWLIFVSWCGWLDERGLLSCFLFFFSFLFCVSWTLLSVLLFCSLLNPCNHFTLTPRCNYIVIFVAYYFFLCTRFLFFLGIFVNVVCLLKATFSHVIYTSHYTPSVYG